MPRINILSADVAERIAAGEVVERPASVVKELVENSIDAGASSITVEIKNGGVRYIRITDNGSGIEREDVRTAFISHATSKIKTDADINNVFTLGFRGEALPSVAAVSRLSLLTKTQDEEIGTSFITEGGQEVLFDDAGCPSGTTLTVKDLFFNTPARMKFLKKDMTEGNYVAEVITRCALSHPEIGFSFIKDGKEALMTPGNRDLYSAVYAIFGKAFSEGLIKAEYEINGIKISGFISKPLANRPNRNMQYFFVNGRCVKIPLAAAALDSAYKNSIMVGKFPSCFLFVEIEPHAIDVNVHPAKTEVRFSDEHAVFEALYYTAKSALNKGDSAAPQLSLKAKRDVLTAKGNSFSQLQMHEAAVNKGEEFIAAAEKKTAVIFQTEQNINAAPTAQRSFSQSEAEKCRKQSETEFSPLNNGVFSVQRSARDSFRDTSSVFSAVEPSPVCETQKMSSGAVLNKEYFKAESEPQHPDKASSPDIDIKYEDLKAQENETIPPFRIIGEAFATYIMVECENKLLIIDKHAAHERMIFNSLKKESGSEGSQLLMLPVKVTLTNKEYDAVVNNLELFSSAGYAIDDFGSGCVVVRSCPTELENEDIEGLITEMAGQLLRFSSEPVPQKLDRLYHSTACKGAVRAGDKMNEKEMQTLVSRLLADKDIRYCPHGRPVMTELTKYELEKQFGRLG